LAQGEQVVKTPLKSKLEVLAAILASNMMRMCTEMLHISILFLNYGAAGAKPLTSVAIAPDGSVDRSLPHRGQLVRESVVVDAEGGLGDNLGVFEDNLKGQRDASAQHIEVSLNALPSSIPEKIPVWVLYDYPPGSEETFINLNVKALRRHADPSRFVINLVNSTNIRQFIPDLPAQYDRLPDHGARSDLIRAALMSHHGGVYLDADVLVTRDLTWITDKLADHDFVSYTVGGQNCSNGIFSSNVIAGRKGNRLSADWWADIQRSLVQRCSFEEKRDLENGVCCYDPQGKSRKFHIPWGRLGEKMGHPALQRLQKGEQAFKIFCYDEIDNEGFAPDPAGKLLFRELVKQATSCKAGDTGTKTGTHVMFTSPCPCWELHGKPADEPTLECADGTTGKNIFNRVAYHMFSNINANIAGSASEQEILTGRWIVSSLYRTALGLPPQA